MGCRTRPFPVPDVPDLVSLQDEPGRLPGSLPGRALLAVSFKQFGFDMLPSWIDAVRGKTDVVQLVVGDGGILKLFRGFLASSLKKTIPEKVSGEKHCLLCLCLCLFCFPPPTPPS